MFSITAYNTTYHSTQEIGRKEITYILKCNQFLYFCWGLHIWHISRSDYATLYVYMYHVCSYSSIIFLLTYVVRDNLWLKINWTFFYLDFILCSCYVLLLIVHPFLVCLEPYIPQKGITISLNLDRLHWQRTLY